MNNKDFRKTKILALAVWAFGISAVLSGCGNRSRQPALPAGADLVVCTDLEPPVYEPVVKEFEERTGVSVKVLAGTTAEVQSGFSQASDNRSDEGGQPDWDVAFGVGTELLETYSALWERYESTQEAMIAERFHSRDHGWTAFSVLPLVIMYNTNVVTYREVPTGWESLLEPRWQGRVAFADPESNAVSQAALAAAALTLPDGEDYPGELAANLNYQVLDGLEQVNEGILDGHYSVGVTTEEAAQELRSNGADIDYIYPEEGTLVVLEGSAVRAGCGHEEAAKQFLDFTVSKEVQKILSVSRSRRSVRTDIAAEKGMDAFERLPLLDAGAEHVSGEKREALAAWQEAFLRSDSANTGQPDADSGKGGAS